MGFAAKVLGYLMPASLVCFAYLRLQSGSHAQYRNVKLFSGLQWLWAVKNIVKGPIKGDSGFVTWLLIFAAAHFEHDLALGLTCGLVSLTYGGAFAFIAKSNPWADSFVRMLKHFEKQGLKRTKTWCQIFVAYMLGAAIFWGWYSYDFVQRWLDNKN